MIGASATTEPRDSAARRGRGSSAGLRGERILVTGGAGFIGGHAVAELLRQCNHVGVLDDFSSGLIQNLAPAIDRGLAERDVIVEDIREPAAARAITSWRPTIIVHLAAQSKVATSVVDPLTDVTANVGGTVNILAAATGVNVRRIVLASSGGTVYGDARAASRRVREQARGTPASPYGLSKSMADDYLRLFANLYGLHGTSLAIGNAYGPGPGGGPGEGVVAAFVRRMVAGETPAIHGDGEQTRDFVFVHDVVEAIVAACVAGPTCRINIGSGTATSLKQLLSLVASATGQPAQATHVAQPIGEVRHICLDVSRARQLLGWRPRTGLDQGIRHVLDAVRTAQTTTT